MTQGAVICLSGGTDSTTLLYYIMREYRYTDIECVGFNYNQKNDIELRYARKIAENLDLNYNVIHIDLSQFGKSILTPDSSIQNQSKRNSTIVPVRNAIFLCYAVGLALKMCYRDVFYAPNLNDFKIYPDCRTDFVRSMNNAMKKGYNVGIHAPFVKWSKTKIYSWGIEHKVPYEKTYTCYCGNDEPCMECDACVERLEAFEKLGRDYYGQKI